MSSPIFVIKGFDLAASLTEEGQAAYMPDVEALRGANSLETVTTAGLGLKTLSMFVINGQIDFFVLTTGSADANDPDNQVQPLDHDNTTNNVYWQRSGGFTTGLLGAQVTRAAAQNLASGVETAISFDTIRSNTGEFDNAVPTRFTCIKPGTYVFHGSLAYAANSSGMRSAFLKKNGSAYIAAETRPANASGSTVIPVTAFVTLAVGDYVELVGLQTSAGNLDVQKLADYSPEFSGIFLGSAVAQAIPQPGITGNQGQSDVEPSPTVTQPFVTTDAGWYRLVETGVPFTGGITIRRINQGDSSVLDCGVQFGILGDANVGVIQLVRNVMSSASAAIDALRVSYEGTNAYLDVHIILPGSFEVEHDNTNDFVKAPYLVDLGGADGEKVLNVTPNVIATTDPVDVPQLNSNGIKIAQTGQDGWVMPVNVASRASFDPATVTTAQLAQHVVALIYDCKLFGAIREGLPSAMHYLDMLQLPGNLVAENTAVAVDDSFRITAAPDNSVLGIYVPVGTANGHTLYRLQGYEWNTALTRCVRFDGGTAWEIYGPSGILYHSSAPVSPAQPWNTTQWQNVINANVTVTTVAPNITLTYNVLTDTHTGVYVKVPSNTTYNGVYLFTGTINGKRGYYQQGGANNARLQWNGTLWVIQDDVNGTIAFSSEDTTFPDQALVWSPDATITRLDAVDLAAGVTISNGSADTNGLYIPQLGVYTQNQTVYRRTDGLRFLVPDGSSWWITESTGFLNPHARSDTWGKFPWNASWASSVLIAKENKIAGPTNWHV